MYGKPFGIQTHRNKGFSTKQKIVIFRDQNGKEKVLTNQYLCQDEPMDC
jgi:hypothetical protein